ncbi:MAG: corrinoid protein [Candidatus Ratteibacteria bacterium]|nr:corrinoid protein [Candidatus Ratteibacteria bacterium]
MADLQKIADGVIKGQAEEVAKLVKKALDEGIAPKEILDNGLIGAMNIIGQRFKNNEVYVPEVLIAARAMHRGMDVLKPMLVKSGIKPIAKVAVGTVKGDLHDIGKNLVIMMLQGAGFETNDLGIDLPPEKFVEAAKKGAQIIGLSALLTTTMPAMKKVIDVFKEVGIRDKVKIMIGGAPVTQEYADEIGADGYAPDAASAVDKAKELLNL